MSPNVAEKKTFAGPGPARDDERGRGRRLRTLSFVLAWCGALGLSAAAGAPRLPPERGIQDLVGTWQGLEADAQGRKGRFTTVWEIGDGVIARTTQPGGPAGEWRFTVDPNCSPKQIDLFPAAGQRLRGVYTVHGDRLKVCYVAAEVGEDHPRPISVETGGPKLVLLTFQRKGS